MAPCRQWALNGPRMRGARSSRLFAISFDTHQSERLAHFWAGVLGLERADECDDGVALLSGNDAGYRLGFRPSQVQKITQNRLHFDLTSSCLEDQQQTVARARGGGGAPPPPGAGPRARARGGGRPPRGGCKKTNRA
ncbi:VOC family protein, partial [Streptomyces hirsutus]|uniref:VOC family protein n=1 Tax=Streptomyces hirsutus TaxID=35620 RepID=UPI00363030DA